MGWMIAPVAGSGSCPAWMQSVANPMRVLLPHYVARRRAAGGGRARARELAPPAPSSPHPPRGAGGAHRAGRALVAARARRSLAPRQVVAVDVGRPRGARAGGGPSAAGVALLP